MSLFLVAAILGAGGLTLMALLGFVAHAGGGSGHAVGHVGHASHAAGALGGKLVGAGKLGGGRALGVPKFGVLKSGAKSAAASEGSSAAWLWSLLSPRVLFSVCFGFGITGLLAEKIFLALPFFALAAIALVGGAAFEGLLVGPLWRLLLRFSSPAQTLDHALFTRARAVTGFDKDGNGLVSVEVDGQIVQLLGTLQKDEQATGVRVHVGDELLVEEIDDVRQRCRVSLR